MGGVVKRVWSQGAFSVLSAGAARRDSVWLKWATGVGVSPSSACWSSWDVWSSTCKEKKFSCTLSRSLLGLKIKVPEED